MSSTIPNAHSTTLPAPPAEWTTLVRDMPMALAADYLRFYSGRMQDEADRLSSLAQRRMATSPRPGLAPTFAGSYYVGLIGLLEAQLAAWPPFAER